MRMHTLAIMMAAAACTRTALAQRENPDFRIRAQLRTPSNGAWGANESIGNVDFRIQSRFLQVYYGGVHRSDEFKFSAQLSFTGISGFASNFPASPYNSNYDIYIGDAYVGRAVMGQTTFGVAELAYDSRHPDLPTLPLPAQFPDPVSVGDTVRIFFAAATMPEIGSPLPPALPLIQAELVEAYVRGDANQDRKVDQDDYDILAASFDPFQLTGPKIGPANGDFTADGLSTAADYAILVQNWTDNDDPPAAPAPIASACAIDYNQDGNLDQGDIGYLIGVVSGEPNTTGIEPDLNQDGNVDQADVSLLIGAIAGAPCP